MLGRRGFLGAILASPVAGKEMAKSAIDVAMKGGVPLPMDYDNDHIIPEGGMVVESALDKAYRRAVSIAEIRESNRSLGHQGNIPVSILTKKSWSPAFKAHIKMQRELRDYEDRGWKRWFYDGDEATKAEKMRLVAKMGLSRLLK